jgi:hypothetical protein
MACKDCGCEVSPVRRGMRHTWGISDKLWKKVGMKPQGNTPFGLGEFFCIDCLRKRLGPKAFEKAFQSGGYTTHLPVTRKQWRLWIWQTREQRRAAP